MELGLLGSWKEWVKKCWDRTSWRKRALNKLLHLRRNGPANRAIDCDHCSRLFDETGGIYAIFRLHHGRLLCGPAGQGKSRRRLPDLFHKSLSLEHSPFCFVVLLLFCWRWCRSSGIRPLVAAGRMRKRASSRRQTKERCTGSVASIRWPRGYNSAIPGEPISWECSGTGRRWTAMETRFVLSIALSRWTSGSAIPPRFSANWGSRVSQPSEKCWATCSVCRCKGISVSTGCPYPAGH